MTLQLSLVGLAGLLSWATVGLLRRWFLERLMDIPNERSSHTRPTPRGGGLGFIVGFAIAALLAGMLSPSLLAGIPPLVWWALVPLVLIGILDDWRDVPSSLRYVVQLGVAIGVVSLCGAFPMPWLAPLGAAGGGLAFAITVVGFTALINFYNFMDGVDGIVAGVTAVQLSFLALWCQQPVLWLWVAALIGFLLWNWAPAKIFMGDAGSTVLGAVVASALLSQSQSPDLSWAAVVILLPLVGDAVYTLARRLSRGENIFQAHRTHLYQRLHQVGWGHDAIAGVYMVLTVLLALGLWRWGTVAAWEGLAVTLAALLVGEGYVRLQAKGRFLNGWRWVRED
jgi:UDP-N-acetylmuramyl pentapeptide phosphotransferase/UDP-N-acetylglucosamine-1-phosphate transferase